MSESSELEKEYRVEVITEMHERLKRVEETLDGLREGVNTIGLMMNQVTDAFGQIMTQMQSGGLPALLGKMMGGNKNG